jgi:hypothetical protein
MPLTWVAGDVLVQGTKYKSAIGLDVDEQTVRLGYWPASSARASVVVTSLGSTVPFAQALQEGLFDGAILRWDRVVLPAWGAVPIGNGDPNPDGSISDGRVIMNEGRVSTLEQIGRIEAQMKVKSHLVLLDIDMPRNIWQPTCIHTLYDSGCTLLKQNFVAHGVVGSGATNTMLPWSGSVDGIYNQGTLIFGSGQNAGLKVTVKHSSATALIVAYPLQYIPAAGDSFTVYQGCNKSQLRCQQFNNLVNWRAYPDVPPPELAA